MLMLGGVLRDIVTRRKLGREHRLLLERVMQRSEKTAETASRSIMDSFCDALAVVDSSFTLLETSPSLSTMLSVNAVQGRPFLDFVAPQDRESLQEFLPKVALMDDERDGLNTGSVCLSQMTVHLQDPYAVNTSARLFSACFPRTLGEEPVYLIGISESWKPPTKQPRRPKKVKDILKESTLPMFPGGGFGLHDFPNKPPRLASSDAELRIRKPFSPR
eukprot:TRINITY_DN18043_c0_g1_i2.p1 TRINITY_DN18043_c0_g1~~TRINITY_DN18043_c0_g1_i2.p1  ORF type:complete len:218 (+),score=42.87 TRINITY_DN18043_c0_g1_i2:950-1603(+)